MPLTKPMATPLIIPGEVYKMMIADTPLKILGEMSAKESLIYL